MRYIEEHYFPESSLFFDLEKPRNLELLNGDPDIFITYLRSYHNWQENKDIVLFIDEIQYLDNPTSFLKYIHDTYTHIKCIVSWSSTLEIRWKLWDSLVGRIIKFDIFPLSFPEFLLFIGKPNLVAFLGQENSIELIHDELRFFYDGYIRFGWYPKVVLINDIIIKKKYLEQIYSTYIEKDIKDIWKIKELTKFNHLIRILASQVGSLINFSEIANTVNIAVATLNEWIFLLENTFVIRVVRPYSTNLRGELTKMPKIFFIDNGIRNSIIDDFELSGPLLENGFFNQINHARQIQDIRFYRTQDKKEIDFILDTLPYELKLVYNGKNLSALDYFSLKYQKSGTVVTLAKKLNIRYRILYPWEV
jgi:uncharacterized protein